MHSQPNLTQSLLATTKIPYDVLREIFLYCLPRFPLDEIQPNAKSAPILLCHVCSFWRAVALETPPLWSHLRYRLPIRWEDDGQPIAWSSKIFLRDMAFLRWWRENQGPIATCVRFQFYEREIRPDDEERPLTDEDTELFVDYLLSARHLDIGRLSEYLFQQTDTSGSPAGCPRLHSLVTRYPNYPDTRSKIKINFSPWNDEVFGSDDNDDGTYSRPDYEEDDEPNFNDEEYDESRQSLNEEDDNELISVDEGNTLILNDGDIAAANSNEEDESPNVDHSDEEDDFKIHKPILVPFHIPPTLQRLCIKYVEFELPDTSLNAFTSWSRLTHLSLHDMFMLPDVWYSLIRGLPNLQWGYFNVFLQLVDDDPEPSKFILPFLSTLSVTIDNSAGNVHDDPIGQLFRNLHLPALHDLSIYVDADPSELPHVAITINNVLRSAPTITKLTLGLEFLGFYGWRPGSDSEDIEWEGVEKISALAPHLTNLLLDMCYFRPEHSTSLSKRLPFWNKFLGPSHWLDLASPVNAIQKITAIVQKSSRDGPLVEAHIRGALELDEAHGEGAGGVVFEIVEEEKKGLSPSGVGWRTWGPSPL